MIATLLFFLIIVAILGKLCEKTWVNPLTLFSAVFVVVVSLGTMGLYDMRNVSAMPYILIFLGILSFAAGYLLYYIKPFRLIFEHRVKGQIVYYSQENLFNIILIIAVIFWGILAVITIGELMAGIPYKTIRDNFAGISEENAIFKNSLLNFIVKWILVPMVNVVMVKIIYSVFGEHYTKVYYIAAIFILATYVFATGSRIILLYVVVQILFLFFLKGKGQKKFLLSKKVRRGIRILVLVAVIGVVIVTIFRPAKITGDTASAIGSMYIYGAVAIPLLDYWTGYVDTLKIRTGGVAFFFGILQWIARFKFPMPSIYYSYAELISYCSDTYIAVFGPNVYNAFNTVFFYFYLDFGYFGVIVGSLVFGLMSSALYRRVRREQNEYITLVFLLFLIALVGSFARWQFTTAPYIMMYIMLRVLYKRRFVISK